MTKITNFRPIEILLVEDNPGDVRLTQEALKLGKVNNHLVWVKDGDEAMAYLNKQGNYIDAVKPDIILLDLNLPKQNGREILAAIKQNSKLKCIPVIILTSSEAEEDIHKSYELHANCYISKPVNIDKFVQVVKSIDEFWLSIVTLPPCESF